MLSDDFAKQFVVEIIDEFTKHRNRNVDLATNMHNAYNDNTIHTACDCISDKTT